MDKPKSVDNFVPSWAAKMKEARKARGITQADLASRVSVSQATVAAWEAGKTRPNDNVLPALEVILGVGAADIRDLNSLAEVAVDDEEARFKNAYGLAVVGFGSMRVPTLVIGLVAFRIVGALRGVVGEDEFIRKAKNLVADEKARYANEIRRLLAGGTSGLK